MLKQTSIILCFLLTSICGWAQNDSICVFEGTVTNVPDGTEISLAVANTPERLGTYTVIPMTTVKDGKFYFEKAMKPGHDCYVRIGNFNMGMGINVQLTPGMKTTITGDGTCAYSWIAENDHPDQKESNIYAKFMREKMVDYLEIGAKRDKASSGIYEGTTEEDKRSASEVARDYNSQLNSLIGKYFDTMFEFMKNRPFGHSYEKGTTVLAQYAYYKKDDVKLNKCRELFAKFPDDNSGYARSIEKWLKPQYKPLEQGDQAKDYLLNDHDGKSHSILETLGKGKYLLIETAWKACEGEKASRPKDELKQLVSKYSDKFDIVTLAVCAKGIFDMKEFPREEWLELNLDTSKASLFVEMQETYFPWEERFIFISPEGKILGKCDSDQLNEEFKKYFPFAQ